MLTIKYDAARNRWTVANRGGSFASSKQKIVLVRRFPTATVEEPRS